LSSYRGLNQAAAMLLPSTADQAAASEWRTLAKSGLLLWNPGTSGSFSALRPQQLLHRLFLPHWVIQASVSSRPQPDTECEI